MDEKTCWAPFSFLTVDHKEAQAFLDRRAAQGWELVKVRGPFAKFRRTERKDLTYFLDWSDPKFHEDPDYLQLCADAGWELVQTVGYLNLYASKPGTRPLPIQTDPALEFQRCRKKVLHRMFWGSFPLLLLMAILVLAFLYLPHRDPGALLWEMMSESNLFALLFLLSPLYLPGGAAYLVYLARRLLRWRRAAQAGEPLPGPDPRWARVWSRLNLARWALFVPLLLCTLADGLLNQLFSAAYCVALFFGTALISARESEQPNARSSAPVLLGVTGLLLLCVLLRGPARAAFPGRFPTPPIQAQAVLDTSLSYAPSRRDTFLGSRAEWTELLPGSSPELHTTGVTSSLSIQAEAWASPWLASRAFSPIPEGMEPVEGLEGVWWSTDPDRHWTTYLIREGRVQVRLRYYGLPQVDPLDTVLAWVHRL